jgi:hypothetical protein
VATVAEGSMQLVDPTAMLPTGSAAVATSSSEPLATGDWSSQVTG